jgi:peptide/nickel transport system substrate-binding protein/oligopeptide transport system substrate-binding protein
VKGLEETDLEEAKSLLTDAGFPEGRGMPEIVLRLSTSAEATRIGSLMAETWKEKLGVPVRVNLVQNDLYFQSLKESDYDVGFSTWIGDFADPYSFLQMWRKDSNLNDAHYNDTDYEKLMDESMGAEGTDRLKKLSDAETLLLERGTVLPISYSPAVNIIDLDEIDGWFPNALDVHPYKYLSYKAYRPLPGIALLLEE